MLPPRTKKVQLFFKRDQLLYDVKNLAYVEADVMEDESHAKHQVFDIGEDGNIDRVTRMFDLAFARCLEFCYPYSKRIVDDGTYMTDVLRESPMYGMELLLPDDFSITTVNLLEKYIHEFMVCWALWDWLSITKPSSKTNWQEKLAELEDMIKGTLNARIGRVRLTQSPF